LVHLSFLTSATTADLCKAAQRRRTVARHAVRSGRGMEIQTSPSPGAPIPEGAMLRSLLDRLLYTRDEPDRQVLLAQIKSEIQAIRALAEF
jgi:hypothetical protein